MESIKQSEIKPCVIQFTRIDGLDMTVGSMEAEDYASILSHITHIYDTTINLYEGHIDKHEGKVFMTTFGVPVSHEEDPERAIRSALLLRKKIEEYGAAHELELAVSIGMYLGKVYAGDVGSDLKKEYTVMGDAVNIAARMMQSAHGSQIVVSDGIYRNTKPMFKFSDPVDFQPYETADKIKIYEAVDQRSGFIRRRGIEGLVSPLIGRTEELNILKEHLDALLDRKRNIVVITGEAGVGKSRLLEELFTFSLSTSLEKATTINWCSGYCSPYKEAIYLPFIEMIKQMSGIDSSDSEKTVTEKLLNQMNTLVKDEVDEFYPYIAHLLNIKLDSRYEAKVKYLEPEVMKVQTHLAIATLLRAYALKEPCVYVFDDLYLADMSLLEALKFFLETSTNVPMLVFLLSRPHKASAFWDLKEKIKPKLDLHEMHLRRLNSKETKEISKNLLHIPKLPVTLLNDMVVKADGNPFFLEEIIKLLIAEGILYKKGDEWYSQKSEIEFSIPYTIEAIIRNRFDMLSSSLRGTLEEMAVVGRTFPKKILRAFSTKWEHLDDFIGEITELGFVTTENEEDYQFNHALVREVIYSSIPEKRKKALHLKVGETIEALYKDRLPEFYEILFEHFSQTEQHEKTIDYGLKAAENAQKRYANYEAILMYCAVLKELGTLGGNEAQRRQVLIALGKIHNRIGKSDDAFEFYQQALQHCANDLQEAEIYRHIADTYDDQSDYDKATETYNRALEKLNKSTPIEKAQTLAGAARIFYEKGDFQACIDLLMDALDFVEDSVDIKARRVQAIIFDRFGSAYYSTGKRKESFDNYQKALKLYEILDDIHGQGVVYNNLCDYYTGHGDYPSALTYLYKSLEIDKTTGNMLGQAIVYYNLGDTYYQVGDLPKANELFSQSLDVHKQVNNRLGAGYGTWGLGLVHMEQGSLDAAQECFNKALSIFNEVGSRMWQIAVMLSIADLYLLQKEHEKSRQLCDNIRMLAEKSRDYDALNEIKLKKAQICIALGQKDKKVAVTHLDEAKQYLRDLEKTIETYGASTETKFEVFFQLCRVNYYLGVPKDTLVYCQKAEEMQNEILGYMKEERMRDDFLNRTLYKSFKEFCTEINLNLSR